MQEEQKSALSETQPRVQASVNLQQKVAHLQEQVHSSPSALAMPNADALKHEVQLRPAPTPAVGPKHGMGAEDVHLRASETQIPAL